MWWMGERRVGIAPEIKINRYVCTGRSDDDEGKPEGNETIKGFTKKKKKIE